MIAVGSALLMAGFWIGAWTAADSPAPPLAPAALQGAWKLKSLSYDGEPQQAIGYMMFHGDHYAFVTTRERPELTRAVARKPFEQLTDAEKRLYYDAFRSMTAAAGPYHIEGDEIAYMREAVRTPYLAGLAEERRSWFEDGRLIQDFMGGGRRQHYVWERPDR